MPVNAAHPGHHLLQALRHHRDDEVLRLDGTAVTGGDFYQRISQFIAAFDALGEAPGATFGVLARNVPEVLTLMGAGWVRGLCRVPLHPQGSLDDHAYIVADAGITTLVVDESFAERARELATRVPSLKTILTIGPAADATGLTSLNALADQYQPGPVEATEYGGDQILAITYTGGTTGQPKGVIITAGMISELTKIQLGEWEWPARPRFLICTPLSHAGSSFFLPILVTGGMFVVLEKFEAGAVLRAIEDERINSLMLVPSMLYALLDHPDARTRDLSSLEAVYYGASPASPVRLAEAMDRFGPVFAQFYGQSEAPQSVTYFSKADHRKAREKGNLASCGRPSVFVRAALLGADGRPVPPGEPGEICVAGPLVSPGYWNRPEATAEAFGADGWLRTGDIAREDADGLWYIVDRSKDMIVTGGFNVFPREVEDVISADPAVAQVAVIGTPDDKWGEAVTALVVPRPGFELNEAAVTRITTAVRAAKGPVHAPKKVLPVDSIPVTGLGKPDKKALRARFWTGERAVG
jgi:fatty-acyl-CoA synthase